MIPTATDVKQQGDLGGQKIAMEFDANSIEHIMSVLTDLYSDPGLAVIREYSTNAWDSHVEAGTGRPIEVQTPTPLSPYFKVRDYGVGLSVNDVSEVYSKYGASTKRGTDTQTGMLGLGCKSGLTFAHQFSVTAVKNGVKVIVSVSKNERGTGEMHVVDTVSTDEPNGVEVSIPAKVNYEFDEKAKNFFRFWPKGSVLLNGKEPDTIEGKRIDANILLVSNLGSDFIVQGNVPYRVDSAHALSREYYGMSVVATVPVGSVNFTPSREDLHYTALTAKTLAGVASKVKENLVKTRNADIASAASPAEALQKMLEWAKIVSFAQDTIKYKGQVIPTRFDGNFILFKPFAYRYKTQSDIRQINLSNLDSILVVHGFDLEKVTSTHQAKLNEYCDQNNIDPKNVYFTLNWKYMEWFDKDTSIDWPTIKAIKLPSKPRTYTRSKSGEYDVFTGHQLTRMSLDKTKPICYYSSADYRSPSAYFSAMAVTFPDIQIVCLGKNRWDKFSREYPQATTVEIAARREVEKAVAAITERDKAVINIDWRAADFCKRADHTKIDDPELKQIVSDMSGASSPRITHYKTVLAATKNLGVSHGGFGPSTRPVLNKYPLFNTSNMEHSYIYINAVYANNKDKS